MHKPESSNSLTNENKPVNQSRRRLSKVAIAAPIIATLAARPALACSVSGFMSGNASPGNDPRCEGYGCTPGFWKNNTKAWKVYSPGKCSSYQGPKCTSWDPDITGTTLGQILPSNCSNGGAYFSQVASSDTLMSIFSKAVNRQGNIAPGYAEVCHYIAAILNAAASSVSYGSTVADIQAGLCKAAQEGKIRYFTTELLARLNERGCMFDAWGNCEQNFTRDTAGDTCIPICQTGTHWDSGVMKCVPD